MSAPAALFFHWRLLPCLVRSMSWLLERTLGVGAAVGFSKASNLFAGMLEAPQRVKPWLPHVSRGGSFVIMRQALRER